MNKGLYDMQESDEWKRMIPYRKDYVINFSILYPQNCYRKVS